jgi:hypothetical protein
MNRRSIILASSALSLLLAAGCASSPSATAPSTSIRLATLEELKSAYGYSYDVNPYLEPSSIFRGKLTEFVVLRVDLNLSAPAKVLVAARVADKDGRIIAEPKDLYLMTLFWDMWQTSDPNAEKRLTSLERSYLPGLTFEEKAGRHRYYLVLTGKYPLERPATVQAELAVSGMDSIALKLPLPELPAKK